MSGPRHNIWAPWRIGYLQQLGSDQPPGRPGHCFLCEASLPDATPQQQAQRLLLRRDEHVTLLLNRYPYANGHLLVAPHEHVPDLLDLSPASRSAMMEMTELACRLLKMVINPQGFNVGCNLGRAAGAGVPGHLHMHIVPRWTGDTNMMEVIGGVRVIPQALDASYTMLLDAVDKVT